MASLAKTKQTKPLPSSHGARPTTSICASVSQWPFSFDATESLQFDHYVHRFARSCPTFAEAENPFLRVILPLSVESRAVFDSLLTLGCVQSWSNGTFLFERSMLLSRQKALRGCRVLIQELGTASDTAPVIRDVSHLQSTNGRQTLYLLMNCALLLLYEKLTGDLQESGSMHLDFLARMLSRNALLQIARKGGRNDLVSSSMGEALRFAVNLFLYNDFVLSTSLQSKAFSALYRTGTAEDAQAAAGPELIDYSIQYGSRHVFPGIMTRIAAGDEGITDWDIARWDGNLGWLPSFALQPDCERPVYWAIPVAVDAFVMGPEFKDLHEIVHVTSWSESCMTSELYRIAGSMYRRQRAPAGSAPLTESESPISCLGNLPGWSMQLLAALPVGSSFESSLLWPLGVIGKTLSTSYKSEREALLARLESMDLQFHSKPLRGLVNHLKSYWATMDQ
ncbi:hypothetical protein NQ176_g5336 [Zarea fungicola]|uniref:Uncharacterized protein n=1 Tax=Zarea fungicola TaxID=93591 RepID=A0ACC1NAY3_9HYPO|nr:hypothetical protein NQ176_g5336 [Lecanicillium fungicola]